MNRAVVALLLIAACFAYCWFGEQALLHAEELANALDTIETAPDPVAEAQAIEQAWLSKAEHYSFYWRSTELTEITVSLAETASASPDELPGKAHETALRLHNFADLAAPLFKKSERSRE